MKTNVNIFKDEWCDLLFQNRNQNYGACVLRKNTGKRHLMALMLTLSLFLTAFTIIHLQKKHIEIVPPPTIPTGKVEISDFTIEVPQPQVKKPPMTQRPTIRFDQWLIASDIKVKNMDSIPTQNSLTNSTAQIGTQNSEGDPNAKPGSTSETGNYTIPIKTVDIAENMPEFPGGQDKLMKYLSRKLRYPRLAEENKIFGTAFIRFVVDNTGQIRDVEVARGFDESCENEAMRVIKAMPTWKPGLQNGNPVNVRMIIPVKFQLND